MTKLEKMAQLVDGKDSPFYVADTSCPSDIGLKNCESCSFQAVGIATYMECVKCWLGEYEEDKE